jgi:hypothetical protein
VHEWELRQLRLVLELRTRSERLPVGRGVDGPWSLPVEDTSARKPHGSDRAKPPLPAMSIDGGGGFVYGSRTMRTRRVSGCSARRPAHRLLWGLGVVAGSLSCGSEDEPFVGHVSRSRLFEYHTREPATLCPTLLDRLDEHASTIGTKVGVDPAAGRQFRYYKFRDPADFAAAKACPDGVGACGGRAVYSTKFFHAHELVHAYAFRGWASHSAGLLAEGVAVALSCDPFLGLLPGQRPHEVSSYTCVATRGRNPATLLPGSS